MSAAAPANISSSRREPANVEFLEVGCGLLARRQGWLSLFVGAKLHFLPFLVPILQLMLTQLPPLRPPAPPLPPWKKLLLRPLAITLVAPTAAVPRAPARVLPPKTGPEAPPPDAGASPREASRHRARVSINFVLDIEQSLPLVLRNHRGKLGFAHDGRVTRAFDTPGWSPVPLPEEGVKLSEYYHLVIDFRLGRYDFVDQIVRAHNGDLARLTPYALFEFAFMFEMEDSIRKQSAGQCAPGDELDALVKLDRLVSYRVESVRCIPAGPLRQQGSAGE